MLREKEKERVESVILCSANESKNKMDRSSGILNFRGEWIYYSISGNWLILGVELSSSSGVNRSEIDEDIRSILRHEMQSITFNFSLID